MLSLLENAATVITEIDALIEAGSVRRLSRRNPRGSVVA